MIIASTLCARLGGAKTLIAVQLLSLRGMCAITLTDINAQQCGQFARLIYLYLIGNSGDNI